MAPLTEPEVQAIFQELETLHAPLHQSEAIRGLEYFKEQLMLTNAKLDRALDLKLKVIRALALVQEKYIYARALTTTPSLQGQEKQQAKEKFTEWDVALKVHQAVFRAVCAMASALAAKSRDIKALADVTVKQLRLAEGGGIDPEAAGADAGLVDPVDFTVVGTPLQAPPTDDTPVQPVEYFEQVDRLAELAKAPVVASGTISDTAPVPPTAEPPPVLIASSGTVTVPGQPPVTVSAGDDLVGLFDPAVPGGIAQVVARPATSPATQVVTFDTPVGSALDSTPRQQVPETRAVPIEALLEMGHDKEAQNPAHPVL